MGLFGFLKKDNGLNEHGIVSVDDFDVNLPVVIKAGSFSNEGILYATDDALCMYIITEC